MIAMKNKRNNICEVGSTLQMDLAYSFFFFHLNFQMFFSRIIFISFTITITSLSSDTDFLISSRDIKPTF